MIVPFVSGILCGALLVLLVLTIAANIKMQRERAKSDEPKQMESAVLEPSDHIANLVRINRESCPDWDDLKTVSDAVLALYLRK